MDKRRKCLVELRTAGILIPEGEQGFGCFWLVELKVVGPW